MRTCQGPIDMFLRYEPPSENLQFSLGTHLRKVNRFTENDVSHPFGESLYISNGTQLDSPRAPSCCVSFVSEE